MNAESPKKLSVLEKHGFTTLMRWPNKQDVHAPEHVFNFFLRGLVPEKPPIGKDHTITAFGSCFAGNVSRYLAARGYKVNAHKWKHANSDLVRIDEIMVHTPALLSQFEWAFLGKPLGQIFIGGSEEKAKTYHDLDSVKGIITNSDIYIITLGLTEAWYDLQEERYLWKFIPHRKLDSARFVNKSIGFEENLQNIQRMYDIIRHARPSAVIIFTLSPIPLLGTYSGKAISPANSYSKATLRAALGEFMPRHKEDQNLFYFPSYELVTQHLVEPWKDDNRHISEDAIESIMEIFSTYFLEDHDAKPQNGESV